MQNNSEPNTAAVTDGIQRHYADQCEQYPRFCEIDPLTSTDHARELSRERAEDARNDLKAAVAAKETEWADLAWCAYWELAAALLHGDAALALEKCYSTIALHLRLTELLLGKLVEPKTGKSSLEDLLASALARVVEHAHSIDGDTTWTHAIRGEDYDFAMLVLSEVGKTGKEDA